MIGLVRWPDRLGFSVRVDWPDGSHDMFGWRRNWYQAWRLARRARSYWQPGPIRPHTWAILTLTRRQVLTHRRACRDPGCPRGSITFTDDHITAPAHYPLNRW